MYVHICTYDFDKNNLKLMYVYTYICKYMYMYVIDMVIIGTNIKNEGHSSA
jgi:hypothetical protein